MTETGKGFIRQAINFCLYLIIMGFTIKNKVNDFLSYSIVKFVTKEEILKINVNSLGLKKALTQLLF